MSWKSWEKGLSLSETPSQIGSKESQGSEPGPGSSPETSRGRLVAENTRCDALRLKLVVRQAAQLVLPLCFGLSEVEARGAQLLWSQSLLWALQAQGSRT